MRITNKAKNIIRQLPDKKRYLDFFTAVLTVPILLTVIFTNISNIQSTKKAEPTPTVEPKVIIYETMAPTASLKKEYPTSAINHLSPTTASTSATPMSQPTTAYTPTTAQACKKKIGPITIARPQENQVVTSDPLCFDIQYEDTNYCSVVWSYRINGGSWSDFLNEDICLINASSGEKKIELKVKSTVSNEETTIVRTIIYRNPNEPPTATPTEIKTASSSADTN